VYLTNMADGVLRLELWKKSTISKTSVKFILVKYCQREHAIAHLVRDTALEAGI
jgi:hypothetical protein